MIEELNQIFIKLEKLQFEVSRTERILETYGDFKVKIALMDDSINDIEKNLAATEVRVSKEKQKNSAFLICIMTCIAAIIAAILQGVLTGS
ncbi:MAG TPA: hypothetical protein VMW10_06310 [Alphaproteobacteria bacterium]|nr:hypothetical protein [Alphaproteobacteria bacterium]